LVDIAMADSMMPSMGTGDEALSVMSAGLTQMFAMMVKHSPEGELTPAQEVTYAASDGRDKAGRVKALARNIRSYMKDQTGGNATLAEQLKYVVKTFFLTLPEHAAGFPKRFFGDSVTLGAVKHRLHPLNHVTHDDVVHFEPYMIVEVNKVRYVLSAHRSAGAAIEVWVFRQDKYLEQVQSLATKGWDWTFVDNYSEPTSLMPAKLAMLESMHWKEFEHHDGVAANNRSCCSDAASMCVNYMLSDGGQDGGHTLVVRDIRYEGFRLRLRDHKDKLTAFAYEPQFPGFLLGEIKTSD
jgi:hypothetical protein